MDFIFGDLFSGLISFHFYKINPSHLNVSYRHLGSSFPRFETRETKMVRFPFLHAITQKMDHIRYGWPLIIQVENAYIVNTHLK